MGVASVTILKFLKVQNVFTFAVHNRCGPSQFYLKSFEELDAALTLLLSIFEKKFMVPSAIEPE